MALLTPPPNPILVRVADRQIGDTRICQQVRFVELLHTENAAGECAASVLVYVSMHAATGEELGPELTAAGFSKRPVRLSTDNNTLVDAHTGAILAIRQGEPDADWQTKIDTFTQDTMLQGDFFQYLRDVGLPGTIRQMIIQHIQQADALGRFA